MVLCLMEMDKVLLMGFGMCPVLELVAIVWETSINIKDARPDGKAVKINDHYKAYYSRLWMLKNPIHKGIFNTRKVEGDNE